MAGLFGRAAAGLERKSTDISALTWSKLFGDDMKVKSGVAVNLDSALRTTTVLACARVISQGIAQVPLKLYRETEDGTKTAAYDESLYRILWRQPNDWMTSFEFRETLTMHAVLAKGGFAVINRVNGKVVELLPVMPGNMKVEQFPDWSLRYTVSDSHGIVGVFDKRQILHLRGPSWNGFEGLDIVQTARDAIGLAIATEETHARLHANGAQPGGIISVAGKLTPEARARLKAAWSSEQNGIQNRFKTAVMDQNATFTPMQMKGVDAEHLATRRNQIEEICRALNVFPQMIGYTDKTSTFASAEAFFLAHVIHSLGPWYQRWEEIIDRDLIGVQDLTKGSYLIPKFSLQGLLRGDAKARAEYYTSGIVNGWLTRNEARKLEDLNPLPGLDEPLIPLNMGTQAQRDAAAKEIANVVKSALIGHNGGPSLDDEEAAELELKIGRVLSAKNEARIANARDELSAVLDTLPTSGD